MLTPAFRGNWPVLFKPELRDSKDPSKGYAYSIEAIYPFTKDAPELQAMKDAAMEAIVEKLGADASKWPAIAMPDGSMGAPGSALKSPFRNQAERAKEGVLPKGYTAGNVFMKYKTGDKYKPGLVDHNGDSVIDPSKVYSGRWMRADVTPGYYNHKGNLGVTFYLNHVQLLDDDEPLDGRVPVENVFSKVAVKGKGAATGGKPANSIFG